MQRNRQGSKARQQVSHGKVLTNGLLVRETPCDPLSGLQLSCVHDRVWISSGKCAECAVVAGVSGEVRRWLFEGVADEVFLVAGEFAGVD